MGIFDSGVGGLSVAYALHEAHPRVRITYLADTALFPYGERPDEEIATRAVAIAARLIEAGADALVVACNTASSAALERLRAAYDTPIVGMEPPVKPAVERSRARRVAVLATAGTASGARLARLTEAHAQGVQVYTLPMPGLADLVEAGEVDGERVEGMLRAALATPIAEGIDAVALGCTHYGFLQPVLARLAPPGVEVIDAAAPVARRAAWVLEQAGLDPDGPSRGRDADAGTPEVACYATGDAARLSRAIDRLRASGAALPPLRVAGRMAIG